MLSVMRLLAVGVRRAAMPSVATVSVSHMSACMSYASCSMLSICMLHAVCCPLPVWHVAWCMLHGTCCHSRVSHCCCMRCEFRAGLVCMLHAALLMHAGCQLHFSAFCTLFGCMTSVFQVEGRLLHGSRCLWSMLFVAPDPLGVL